MESGEKKRCIGCYLMHDGKVLLLRKSIVGKKHDNQWGIIAGEMKSREPPIVALHREVREEAGIFLSFVGFPIELVYNHAPLRKRETFVQTFFSYKGILESETNQKIETFHAFQCTIIGQRRNPSVRLSKEHQDFTWAPPRIAITLENLIEDERRNMKKIFGL